MLKKSTEFKKFQFFPYTQGRLCEQFKNKSQQNIRCVEHTQRPHGFFFDVNQLYIRNLQCDST